MSQITFPNGQTLTSSALTPDSIAVVFQNVTANILGFDYIQNAQQAYSAVRVAWQISGQPAWGIGDDVCVLRCAQKADSYSAIRDQIPTNPVDTSVDLTITYVRVWGVHFTLYGPNCFDHARLIRDSMFLTWVRQSLGAYSISYVPRETEPVYVPELFQGQWWKRTDLDLEFNELVTETISVGIITSVEVVVSDGDKLSADFTVTA